MWETEPQTMPLLDVKNLSVEFRSDGIRRQMVTDISFHLDYGEMLSFVGESGCGKSISCLSLARLLPPVARIVSGQVLLETEQGIVDVLQLSPKELRKVRGGGIAYVFQEPSVSLNPVLRIGDQISEAVRLHCFDVRDVKSEVISLLEQVGIPEPAVRVRQYPHELSGGMQQRVMIAMALSSRPRVLIADEPTTALDVTIQAQILELLGKLQKEREMGIILVTHNLGIVAELADRVEVMYAGRIVEEGHAEELIAHPVHPYTRALLAAVPVLGDKMKNLRTIPGIVPNPGDFPVGCRFSGRCSRALQLGKAEYCFGELPEMTLVGGPGHRCACHFAEPGREGE